MIIRLVLAILMLLPLSLGCVATSGMYYWGDYSDTLYGWRKDATKEKASDHQAELLKIIETSDKRGIRVPPGICFEYGYVKLLAGDQENARTLFEREVREYPESAKFVSFLTERHTELNDREAGNAGRTD